MEPKQLPEEFKEFIKFLNENEVKYLLVGGWALGIYGNPRATKDIDFLVAIDDDNLKKLQQALGSFGAPHLNKTDFVIPGNCFRMGRPPMQIDLINEADGIDIAQCYQRRKIVLIDDIYVAVIAREDLIHNKKASGRLQDLADVAFLESLGD